MRWKRPLYFLIKPLPAQLAQLVQLCAKLGIHLTYSSDRWHCTFLALGESSPEAISMILQAMRTFEAEPFWVAFDWLEHNTLQPRKGLRGASDFQSALARHVAACGVPLPAYKFGLHLNLEYANVSDRRCAIPPVAWPVEEILLVESVNGQARHILHGSWQLERRQGTLDFPEAA